jgi:hypothetical protein
MAKGPSDVEWTRSFDGYVCYFEDLAGWIGGTYGLDESVAAGVHAAVLGSPAVARISRRPPDADRALDLQDALTRSWSHLHRAHGEVADPEVFDVDANAFLPTIALYSVTGAVEALAIAMHEDPPAGGADFLDVVRPLAATGVFPGPWGATCSGCPQTGTSTFDGLPHAPRPVGVHDHPDPSSSTDRLAMFLRTTRAQALEHRYADLRRQKTAPGKTRRNVPRAEKETVAAALAPTTFFDLLWRTRQESCTDGIDRFVVGAPDEIEAWRFAEALVIVTDATVAAVESVIAATVGAALLADMTEDLLHRSGIPPWTRLGLHATAWRNRTATR